MASVWKKINSDDFPLHFPLETSQHSTSREGLQFYSIKIISLDVPESISQNDGRYQCKVVLYDIAYQQFIGNVWTGKAFSKKNGKITFNETIYFYTSVVISSLKLAVEILTSGNETNAEVIAWTALDLLDTNDKAPASNNSLQYKVPLHHGSCAALFYMGGSLESLNHAANKDGFELLFTITSHPSLMHFIHLIPENFLVGSSDAVPGLFPSSIEKLAQDRLIRPQLQKCCTFVLSGISLKISPSLEKFEADILKKMVNLKTSDDNEQQRTENPSIVQRHLQVGVHNGLCYIQDSDSYCLLVEPVVTQTPNKHSQKKASSLSSLSFTKNDCLVVRSDVKIPHVPDDAKVMLVFVVEYAISFQNNSADITSAASSLGRTPSLSVILLWGYAPLSVVKKRPYLSLSLTNSPVSCPNKILFLRVSKSNTYELSCSILHNGKKHLKNESSKSQSHLHNLDYSNASPENVLSLSVPGHRQRLSSSTSDLSSHKKAKSQSVQHHVDSIPVPTRPVSSHPAITKENPSIEEVSIIPTSMPLIPDNNDTFPRRHQFQRTLYAKLHSPEFPPIHDRQGQMPYTIDTALPYIVDESKEMSQYPQGNDIVFQLLALSGMQSQLLESVFFTFQFYRFPPVRTESFTLQRENSNELISSQLHILTSSFNSDTYGFQITYHIDPSELGAGEYKYFLRSVMYGNLQIDLWDAKSLLYFGTVIVPLKYLCRQGKEAVSATLDLDIKHSEFPDDSPGPTIPFSHSLKGHLHFRLANVRIPLTTKSLSKLKEFPIHDSVVISQKVQNRNELLTTPNIVTKANPILETNKELAKLMASRCIMAPSSATSVMSEERRRKLARMEAVRSSLGKASSPYSSTADMQNLFKERQRDLLVIESYINKHKKDMIRSLLQSSVTSEKKLYPSLGEKSYFEFELTNPFESELNVYVSWSSPKLSIVSDSEEWQYLRKHFGVSQRSENNFISAAKNTSATIFLRGKESVFVPFTYLDLCSDLNYISSSNSLKASSGHHFTSDILSVTNCLSPSEVKVSFQTIDQTLIAALLLKIQPLPPVRLSQAFNFLSPERSLFQKTIMLNNFAHKPYILCSDDQVVCEFIHNNTWESPESLSIFLKTSTGPVGKVKQFFILIYETKYRLSPKQTWAICVRPILRVDLSCAAGQIARSSLVLRGNHASRLVHCFSDSAELVVHPDEPFVLTPCSLQELALKLRCLVPGVGYFRVSMVDQGIKEILHMWLLVIVCQKPLVTKAFQVHLHLGSEVIKRITINNPYFEAKQYEVLVSRPDILQLKEIKFIVEAKKTHALGLYFPSQDVLSETIFLYICDESGKNEETFCIKVICK